MLDVSKRYADIIDFAQPPYVFKDFDLISFVLDLDASADQLQEVCDTFLNQPIGRVKGEKGYFMPQQSILVVTFCNFPNASSENGIAAGYTQYQEVSLAFPVVQKGLGTTDYYVPALFIDGPRGPGLGDADGQTIFPIVVGRSLFGLPKTRGEIDFDYDLSPKRPDRSKDAPIGTVRAIRPDRGDRAPKDFISVHVVGSQDAVPESGEVTEMRSMSPERDGTFSRALLGLRQVHDPCDITKCSHSEIVRSVFVFDQSVPGASSETFRVTFNKRAYPELCEMLGLEASYIVPPNSVETFRKVSAVYADPKVTRVMRK